MTIVAPSELPENALLRKYAPPAGYADCYVTEAPGVVTHSAFVRAFYTTPLFRIERTLLKWMASKPSTDEDAAALASGAIDEFAAWRVEGRTDNQILLADFTGRTRSWLMVGSGHAPKGPTTALYFGSAIVPRRDPRTGERSMGRAFNVLLGFHRLYSRLLLRAAKRRIGK